MLSLFRQNISSTTKSTVSKSALINRPQNTSTTLEKIFIDNNKTSSLKNNTAQKKKPTKKRIKQQKINKQKINNIIYLNTDNT